MQIMAILAMRAPFSGLTAHDDVLSQARRTHRSQAEDSGRMRSSHVRHGTCPQDVVSRDMPRLTHD
jgi:hypothetical protein